MTHLAAIETSLELAAARGGDITPLVYARLFAEQPALEPLFCLDRSGAVRGSMMVYTLQVLLDAAGERSFAQSFVQAEAVNHVGTHGVDRNVFNTFYNVLAATVRELAGADWTSDMATAWQSVLDDLAVWVDTAGT